MDPLTRPRVLRTLSSRPGEAARRWLRRIECELDFAAAFATLFPERRREWDALAARAAALIEGYDPDAGLAGLAAAVQEAEALLAPVGAAAKGYTIHCVGHGHIDMNWMWSWPETVATTHDTFASALSLMRQYPDFTYSQSQASVYALTEKHFPAMFSEIQERVKEGRWEVTAVHWVEGEKNYASGESLTRHLLYTRAYFAAKFGLTPEEVPLDWEPDQFGHANTIPTILAQGGVKFYYACRLGGGFDHAVVGDFPRPCLFWWQGPDGSRLLVNKESTWYNSYVNIGENIALPAVEFWRETKLSDWMNIYGVGNHGGGPTRAEVDYYIEMRDWPIYPQVRFGTAKGWFEKASAAGLGHLPVLDHELNFEFTGCYTTQTLIKQANRFGENYCIEAETLAALAGLERRALLRDAWINVLFNQFHDILPGSGVRQTREHATGLFQETGALTGSIKRTAGIELTKSLDTLALLPDTPEAAAERASLQNTPFVAGAGIGAMESGYSKASGGGTRFKPFVVYNPCAWTRTEAVTVRLYDTDFEPGRVVARDDAGQNHPTLFLARGSDWNHGYIDILFFAQEVPALGYRTFVLCEGAVTAEVPRVQAQPRDRFETPHLTLGFDRYRGGIEQVQDRGGRVYLEGGYDALGAWRLTNERPRGMTAWVLGGECRDERIGVHSHHIHGIARNQGTAYPSGESIAYVVHQHLKVPETKSAVHVRYLVQGLSPRVDVTADVDWREIGDPERGIPGLRLDFPCDRYDGAPVRYETPFGSVERSGLECGVEVPSLRYAHLPLEQGAFTLLNDCKYGHSLYGSNLRLNVIRSSFDPDHAPEVCRHTIRYALVFHDSAAAPSELTRLGAAFNHPFLVFPAHLQSGDGPLSRSFARVETPGVVLTALKRAEEGDGLIVRLVEYDGADTEAVVVLDPVLLPADAKASVVDLMERPTAGSASCVGGTLRAMVRANSLTTVKIG